MRTPTLLLASTCLLTASACWAADHAGIVKTLSGEVSVIRGENSLKVVPNFRLQEGDQVQTGPGGKAGLILDDDTVISLGPNSRVALTGFAFHPAEKKLSLVARIYRGTISFLSGQIAKLAPHQVRIETPGATVGVRGTHVLIEVEGS
ncbi:hypothetical protein GMST_05960 [Geomonas silvestris]|uniref:FecR protein domain-containing protein n=1 Tax=Geomonas silvestris TaxID=2740184 RepID=A0A6V8ME67_9BACT|nr:FecR family protein [Geomonas silvestris]GFO58271.1 hypothetical protein GMST_05960 [Geomonas silvestris]